MESIHKPALESKMDLVTRLQEDMKTAMKSGDKSRLSVIRMLLSDVRNIDLAPKPTTAEDAVAAYGKKLKKTQEEFQKLGKTAEVDQLKYELGVVEGYLPKKASPEETAALIDQFLSQHGFTEKQVGQAMGAFMKAHGGTVDAGIANQVIRQKLSGK
jgi:uncharacterized protein YqeY